MLTEFIVVVKAIFAQYIHIYNYRLDITLREYEFSVYHCSQPTLSQHIQFYCINSFSIFCLNINPIPNCTSQHRKVSLSMTKTILVCVYFIIIAVTHENK